MAMDEKEQRKFIRFLASRLKEAWRELLAYQMLLHLLKQRGLEVEELLFEARKSPRISEKLAEQFEDLDKMLPPTGPDYEDLEKELLAKWKPPGGLPN